ncbi:flagellar motor switch protein FliG [Mariprofundus ferrooxydans]|uniref:Flagellar motor switch protein FliG n=1 Tax=Mariprofundus ferrooxydans PV-1 TaxID=314345 RepID=Q0EZL0_9PROT|nr:flagellar motor switch protein FliG [Mariprofundus ferrooxydans]EAU54694.1 Flagellar motor switch protein FliG [Mariprofundus ferrooxydans PV-1]KON46758.1 flagellar motor switch protein FliG [Mariprofundus ferrooxydans]
MTLIKKQLSGEDKAAILLFALGPEASAPLVEALDDATLTRLGRRMADLGKIDADVLNSVTEEYLKLHQSEDPLLRSTHKDVVTLFKFAIESDRADRLVNELNAPKKFTIWEKLSRLKPEMIAGYIENEHPQTIALILGNIDSSVASRVIAILPEEMRLSVVMRMSKIESVPRELVRDIEETLEKELSDMQGESGISFDGMVSVVDILKGLEKEVARPILDQLRDKDADLFTQVDRLLLIFEDLKELSDRDIQTVLKHISSDDLVKSLKGATDEVSERFFSNMSQRAAEIMKEDMAVMGPMKLADVEDAQQGVLKIIRKLDDEGAVNLGSSDDMV